MASIKFKKSNPDKSDRLALRISAKDKFALELLAQKNGMTVSALIMESLRGPLKEGLTISGRKGENKYIPDEVYDPLLPDRIVKLALVAPELLSDYEKVVWKVIQEDSTYIGENGPNFKAIRDSWESVKSKADDLLEKHAEQ